VPSAEEAEAVARLRRGDIGGLEVLVRAHQVRAVRAAYLITRDRPLAEDLVQSAFLRCYERIHQFDTGRRFGPWFLRAVVNDSLRVMSRRDRHVSLDQALDTAAGALGNLLIDPAPGPAELSEHEETRRAVWAALGRLSPSQRAALVLRCYLGLSELEVAQRLGAAPSTAKWHLHAARERLRRWLAALGPQRPQYRQTQPASGGPKTRPQTRTAALEPAGRTRSQEAAQ
jgi:RNA polymerase sigma-70 factor (ECF subfamily)